MAEGEKRTNLGRGLSALLGEDDENGAEAGGLKGFQAVPIETLRAGRYQPRHDADDDQIGNLAQSIREQGILQPILVRRHAEEDGAFEIIAGERRWRAAQLAEVHRVPVVVKELNDQESLEIALVENLQRQDLSALEEAEGYRRLMDEFSYGQEGLAQAVGKSRSHVANMMRLLGLPEAVKELLQSGELTPGPRPRPAQLGSLLGPGAPGREAGIERASDRGPGSSQGQKSRPKKALRKEAGKDADTQALERDLATVLGLKVEIDFRQGGGTLTLHYASLEQLDDICTRLSHGSHGARLEAAGETSEAGTRRPPKKIPRTRARTDRHASLTKNRELYNLRHGRCSLY